jgi:hypothetical protein
MERVALVSRKDSAEINLGALANNGGPTQTQALISPSTAIDAGQRDVRGGAGEQPSTSEA